MTMLAFALALAAIIGVIFAVEGSDRGWLRRPGGLFAWLISGNWPAKIGAALVVIGSGALLRYAAINFDAPPAAKLSAGVVISMLLGVMSTLLGGESARVTPLAGHGESDLVPRRGFRGITAVGQGRPMLRTLSLVLNGAAFGVAYLTAYSAFALFGYLGNATGVGLLVIVAVAAGVFAVTRSALSLALLSMVGAYLAPAFSIGDPGPTVTYGYYVAAAALTTAMVAARGWRPLIHLSFLFTLLGGVFFAWSARYYSPENFDAMAPMLWLLVALHVAMPLVEQRHVRGVWIERLDVAYLLALPIVALVLAFLIAPSQTALCVLLMSLGATWLTAALYLHMFKRDGKVLHAIIGGLLIGLGAIARFRGLPWDVIALALSVGALTIAVYRSESRNIHNLLAGTVLLFGAVHALTSLAPIAGTVFFNGEVLERLIAAALLVVAARVCRKADQGLDPILFYFGLGWAAVAIGSEVVRWNLISLSLALHWLLIAVAVAAVVLPSRIRSSVMPLMLALGIFGTAVVAVSSAALVPSIVTLFAAPLALIALAMRRQYSSTATVDRSMAAVMVPILAALWTQRVVAVADIDGGYLSLAVAAFSCVLMLSVERLLSKEANGWVEPVAGLFSFGSAVVLAVATTVAISREPSAIVAEIGSLAVLMLASSGGRYPNVATWSRPTAIVAGALLIQANLLRWFGPEGDLTIADLAQMQWPTLVSLLWAIMGALLTLWARRNASRSLWVGGAALLVASAVKLVMLDFGSLGELENILAVIAAGSVFLLVGWLAPMPPSRLGERGCLSEDT